MPKNKKVEAYLHIRITPELQDKLELVVEREVKRVGYRISKAAVAGQLLENAVTNRLK